MNTRQRAFTLIEMLVVVVLISLTLAISLRVMDRLETSSTRTETITRLKSVARALQVYRDDYGDVPPYDPTLSQNVDYDGDGQPDAGPGLWSLVMLDYLSGYRYLSDAAMPILTAPDTQTTAYDGQLPWVLSGGERIEVIPGEPRSMEKAYEAFYGAIDNPGGELTEWEQWRVYCLLARPTFHNAPSGLTGYGTYDTYDATRYENYCSWMMQDAYSGEWKYRPIRRTTPPGTPGDPFPADDPAEPEYYQRQLSPTWSGNDSANYLPASDTVVTWSSLMRELLRQPAGPVESWGYDLILYADGHVASVPGPETDAATDPLQARAVQRPPSE